jgi:hypothetical protein
MRIRSTLSREPRSGALTAHASFLARIIFFMAFKTTLRPLGIRHLDLLENRHHPLLLSAPVYHHNRSSLQPLFRWFIAEDCGGNQANRHRQAPKVTAIFTDSATNGKFVTPQWNVVGRGNSKITRRSLQIETISLKKLDF